MRPTANAELLRLTRRRRLRHHAGAHVVLNLFIVGVWLASGSSYFWPAWVMLGSAVAVGHQGTAAPGESARHLLGDYP